MKKTTKIITLGMLFSANLLPIWVNAESTQTVKNDITVASSNQNPTKTMSGNQSISETEVNSSGLNNQKNTESTEGTEGTESTATSTMKGNEGQQTKSSISNSKTEIGQIGSSISMNRATDEPVITDEGLMAIINSSLGEDESTPITQSVLENYWDHYIGWDRLSHDVVVNNFSGLHYASDIDKFGITGRNNYSVTLNNLDSLVEEANQMPNLINVSLGWTSSLNNVSSLANLATATMVSVPINIDEDFSSLSKLFSIPNFKVLQLVYDNDSGKGLFVPNEYFDGEGIKLRDPFILPNGLSFDFEKASLPQGWTYNNGFLLNSSLKEGDSGTVYITVPVIGAGKDKIHFGAESNPYPVLNSSIKLGYKYIVKANQQNIEGSDVTAYVNDPMPSEDAFKASATDKDGNPISVTIDTSKVDMSKAGDYDVVITATDGQTKTVQVHVKANQQNIEGSDVTAYVNDPMPSDDAFKASATDKDGNPISVTIDRSKVDMSKAGDYDVVITAADGQTKTVQVHVKANQQSIEGSDVTAYVNNPMPSDDAFKASATDKDGNPISVTIDRSKVDMSKAGDYDVVITAADGQTKTVQVHVKANQQDKPESKGDGKGKGNITVHYVDPKGNSIVQDKVIVGEVGKAYSTQPITELPNTGENQTFSNVFKIIGSLLVISVVGIWISFSKKIRRENH